MATERQIQANRENAKRSTGPKTEVGKAAVRLNALKHGLLSLQILLPGEDAAALAELHEGVVRALEPDGEWEHLMVDRIVQGMWRLRRIGNVEVGLFLAARHRDDAERARAEAKSYVRDDITLLKMVGNTITDPEARTAAGAGS